MSNLNRVLLMGRLTRNPELRYTPQGTAVSEIGLAINREYTVGTERRKETTFVDVTLWKRQAEVVCQYLKKGSPIFVEGRLSFDSWETQDGQKRSKLRVVAENFQFLGSRAEGESPAGDDQASSQEQNSTGYGPPVNSPGSPPINHPGPGRWKGGGPWTDEADGPSGPSLSAPGARQGLGRVPAIARTGNLQTTAPSEGAAEEDGEAPDTERGPLGLSDSEIPF